MSTTPRGYPVPNYGDVPDVPKSIQALAEALDADVTDALAALVTLGKVQGGTNVVSVNSSGLATITYPTPFLALRTVVVSLGDTSSGVGNVNVSSFSPSVLSSFQILATTRSGTPLTSGTIRVNWIAFGS